MYKIVVPSHTSSHISNHKLVLQLVMTSHTVNMFIKWHIQEVDIQHLHIPVLIDKAHHLNICGRLTDVYSQGSSLAFTSNNDLMARNKTYPQTCLHKTLHHDTQNASTGPFSLLAPYECTYD